MPRSSVPSRLRLTVGQAVLFALVVAAVVGLAVELLGGVVASVGAQRTGACLALEPQRITVPAPDFALPDLEGKVTRLSSHRGKVVLLNFWATWCPPCVEELPSLVQLQRAMSGEAGFALVTVSVDDGAQVVRTFLERHRGVIGPFPVLMDPSRRTPHALGTEKFPETYLLDREGTVRYRFVNKRDWGSAEAQACIESLL